jgi:hypothetical protein
MKHGFVASITVTTKAGPYQRDIVLLLDNEAGNGIEAVLDLANKTLADDFPCNLRQLQYVGPAFEVDSAAPSLTVLSS